MGDLNRNAAPETCNWCDGSGYDRVRAYGQCLVCDGEGTVLVVQPAERCK